MSLCLNPDCLASNPDGNKFCQKCRSKLFLQERYQAIRLIGQGGFGRTFKAVDNSKPSKPYCVIKQFFPSAQGTDTIQKAAELFELEAIQLEKLGRHPQIPELFAHLTHDDNRQYLVQEYIEGQNLEQELKEKGVFNEAKIRALLTDILPVLDFIHSKGVIHRDIKPENIIRRASDNKAVLVDFGASKVVTPLNRSVTGTLIGSPEYVAPEQTNGKAINASDLYSLGVTCIYLLTQVSPFDLFDTSEHEWVWRQFLVNNPVSDGLGRILDKMIEFGTKKRYQSASEVLQDLKANSSTQTKQTSIQTSPTQVIQTFSTYILKSAKGINYSKLEQFLLVSLFIRTTDLGFLKSLCSKARFFDFGPARKIRDTNQFLVQQKWQEADQETADRMLQAIGKNNWRKVTRKDIERFPYDDLRTIDQLWVKYSNGKFGFSVQKNIWLKVGGGVDWDTECRLSKRVGWRSVNFVSPHSRWYNYDSLIFDLSLAPRGQFPCLGVMVRLSIDNQDRGNVGCLWFCLIEIVVVLGIVFGGDLGPLSLLIGLLVLIAYVFLSYLSVVSADKIYTVAVGSLLARKI